MALQPRCVAFDRVLCLRYALAGHVCKVRSLGICSCSVAAGMIPCGCIQLKQGMNMGQFGRQVGMAAVTLTMALLSACTTFVSNEAVENPKGKAFQKMHVDYVDEVPRGAAVYDTGGVSREKSKVPEKVLALGKRDVPVILALSKEGVGKYLVPQLREKGVDATAPAVSDDAPWLQIRPVSYVVECGAGNLICQTSVSYQVSLTTLVQDEAPLWSASFKVGAPMGGTQDEAVSQAFYTAVADRLGSNKLLRAGK